MDVIRRWASKRQGELIEPFVNCMDGWWQVDRAVVLKSSKIKAMLREISHCSLAWQKAFGGSRTSLTISTGLWMLDSLALKPQQATSHKALVDSGFHSMEWPLCLDSPLLGVFNCFPNGGRGFWRIRLELILADFVFSS